MLVWGIQVVRMVEKYKLILYSQRWFRNILNGFICFRSTAFFPLLLIISIIFLSCGGMGLISENYSRGDYANNKALPADLHEKNPTFIVYGDVRPGLRVVEKFWKKRNWFTWKMFLFPFYELYWIGNGIIGGIEALHQTSSYGYRERRMMRNAVYEESIRSKADFILNVGDYVIDGRRKSHWRRFLEENKIELPLLTNIPYLPTIGSHEWANETTYGLPNFQAVFSYPQFYTVKFADAELFIIDSNIILDQNGLIDDEIQNELFHKWFVTGDDPGQPAWLERKLLESDKTFKIISMHHPLFSFGRHNSDWMNPFYGKNLREKRRKLLDLFERMGILLVFTGHVHFYEHNVLKLGNDMEKRGEIHFIASGGGGVPLRDGPDPQTYVKMQNDYRSEGYNVISRKQAIAHHYCLAEVRTDKVSIQVFAVAGDTSLSLQVIDELTVRKK